MIIIMCADSQDIHICIDARTEITLTAILISLKKDKTLLLLLTLANLFDFTHLFSINILQLYN